MNQFNFNDLPDEIKFTIFNMNREDAETEKNKELFSEVIDKLDQITVYEILRIEEKDYNSHLGGDRGDNYGIHLNYGMISIIKYKTSIEILEDVRFDYRYHHDLLTDEELDQLMW
tara:strand:+ start:427 stop:771 length:345 start_codon:yes stop_codon:yes gene_type:complete